MYSALVAQKRNILVQAPAALITMALMIVLPMLVHLLPAVGKTPLGAFLLPIFYAPLAAIFLFHPLVSIFAGLVVPYLNYVLTGQPALPVAASLSVELLLFSISMLFFNRRKISNSWVVPAAFGIAKLGSGLVAVLIGGFSLSAWFSGVFYGLPGLLVLVLMHAWLVRKVESGDGQG
jgi:membrane-associated HD superfamily phosphohydrolase